MSSTLRLSLLAIALVIVAGAYLILDHRVQELQQKEREAVTQEEEPLLAPPSWLKKVETQPFESDPGTEPAEQTEQPTAQLEKARKTAATPAHAITGRVIREDGRSLKGASVQLFVHNPEDQHPSKRRIRSTTSADDGRFALVAPLEGELELTPILEGYYPTHDADVEVGSSNVLLVMGRAGKTVMDVLLDSNLSQPGYAHEPAPGAERQNKIQQYLQRIFARFRPVTGDSSAPVSHPIQPTTRDGKTYRFVLHEASPGEFTAELYSQLDQVWFLKVHDPIATTRVDNHLHPILDDSGSTHRWDLRGAIKPILIRLLDDAGDPLLQPYCILNTFEYPGPDGTVLKQKRSPLPPLRFWVAHKARRMTVMVPGYLSQDVLLDQSKTVRLKKAGSVNITVTVPGASHLLARIPRGYLRITLDALDGSPAAEGYNKMPANPSGIATIRTMGPGRYRLSAELNSTTGFG